MIHDNADKVRFRVKAAYSVPAVALAILTGITGCAAGQSTHPKIPPATHPQASATATARASAAIDRCYKRKPAHGDIFVRFWTPGQRPVAQRLGGGWLWNVTSGKCLTSVQMMIAGAPSGLGSCTQVGLASDNPGYNPDTTPARPLANVIASKGGSCAEYGPR